MKARMSIAGGVLAVVAVCVALWSAQRLRKTEQAVRRVVEPVSLSLPELFPADALIYAEARGWEPAWEDIDSLKSDTRETATWLALKRKWDEDRDWFPADLRAALESVGRQFQSAEARFGYRPTTREFFETYGKHTAMALVPVAGRERPAALLVVRLPDGGIAGMLQSKLGTADGVSPCEPALRRGFPMFREPVPGVGTVTYGVGRGHLLVSDDPKPVEDALDRLADAADPESPRKPSGTMAEDPTLHKVMAPPGSGAELVLHVRRDQKFAAYDPSLEAVDGALKNAFALAPEAPAVAFGFSGAHCRAPLNGRLSFALPAPGPWERSLPAGAFWVDLPGTATTAEIRASRQPSLGRFFAKPLWAEIDAFLRDGARVRRLGREAFGGGPVLEDAAVDRLPNDARLAARVLRALIDRASGSASPDAVVVGKGYAASDGVTLGEYAVGMDTDEMTAFLLSGALDELAKRLPDWVQQDSGAGSRTWRAPAAKLLGALRDELGAEMAGFIDLHAGNVEPAVVIAGRRVFMVIGEHLRAEIVALHGTGTLPSLAGDALFQEALKGVPPVRTRLSFTRPAERLESVVSAYRAAAIHAEAAFGEDSADGRDVVRAVTKTADAVLGWARVVRARVEWELPDEERPGGSLVILDPEAEKSAPTGGLPDGLLSVPGILPDTTWFMQDWRVATGPVYDAVRKTFLEALPGGEERLKQLGRGTPEDRLLADDLVDGLFRNIRGQAGVAIAVPQLNPEVLTYTGMQAQISRAPAVILFAEFAEPQKAWDACRRGLKRIEKEVNPIPYEEMFESYRRRGGPAPWKADVVVGSLGRYPVMAMDLHVPVVEERRYVIGTLFIIRRDGIFYFTNSLWAARHIGSAQTDSPGTLGARLASLPDQAVPSSAAELRLYRPTGMIDNSRLTLDLQAAEWARLSLRTLGDNPPDDRVAAHRWGWTRGYELVMDALYDPGWEILVTKRADARVRVEWKYLREKDR